MPINVNGVPSYPPAGSSTRDNVSTGFERISSGTRINNAGDDTAGLAIASRFSQEIQGLGVAERNAADAVSLTQVADGALNSLRENVGRIQELSLQAANATLNDQDREALNAEVQQLNDANRDILENTSFNGNSLLSGQNDLSFQIGPNNEDQLTVTGNSLSENLDALGLNEIDISTQEGAQQALDVLDEASQEINAQASDFGAVANRLESTIDNLSNTRLNETEARSRIEDADIAEEASNIVAEQIRDQASIAVQAQANTNQSFVLQLLQ